MEHLGITLTAVFLLTFGLISKRITSTPFTAPMIFMAFGLAVGPLGFGVFELEAGGELLHGLAEATLLLVLFADASTIDLRALRKNYGLPVRLLGIGLPLSIGLGTLLAAWLFPELSLWHAALVAAILAPTDAALGQAVVSSPRVPARIRQALNVESGLNDGICLPFVMMFLVLAKGSESQSGAYWATYALEQLGFGPLVGIGAGYLGGKLIRRASNAGWMSHAFQQLASLLLAALSYCVAEAIGGNGFIAAFVAGMVYGNTVGKDACERALEFAEAEGQLLGLLAFLAFGATSVAEAAMDTGPSVILFALLSLTVMRILPVALSLLGSGLSGISYVFLGWFGPRGLASILYVLLAVKEGDLAHADTVFAICMCTVLFSVVLHGLSAAPGAEAYARRLEHEDHADAREHHPVEHQRYASPFRGG